MYPRIKTETAMTTETTTMMAALEVGLPSLLRNEGSPSFRRHRRLRSLSSCVLPSRIRVIALIPRRECSYLKTSAPATQPSVLFSFETPSSPRLWPQKFQAANLSPKGSVSVRRDSDRKKDAVCDVQSADAAGKVVV